MSAVKLLDAKMKEMRKESDSAKFQEQSFQTEYQTLLRQMEEAQALKMQYYENYVIGKLSKERFLVKKQKVSEKEENLKIRLSVAERKWKDLRKSIKSSTIQMQNDQNLLEYQEITELNPKLMKELVKKIVIRPDGSIHIEWNFNDEMNGLVSAVSKEI